MYQPPAAGTPGWELAPVPGWGMNPLRSGPSRLALAGETRIPSQWNIADWTPIVDGVGASSEEDANQGYIALAAAGGIFFGWFLAWAYFYNKGKKKSG